MAQKKREKVVTPQPHRLRTVEGSPVAQRCCAGPAGLPWLHLRYALLFPWTWRLWAAGAAARHATSSIQGARRGQSRRQLAGRVDADRRCLDHAISVCAAALSARGRDQAVIGSLDHRLVRRLRRSARRAADPPPAVCRAAADDELVQWLSSVQPRPRGGLGQRGGWRGGASRRRHSRVGPAAAATQPATDDPSCQPPGVVELPTTCSSSGSRGGGDGRAGPGGAHRSCAGGMSARRLRLLPSKRTRADASLTRAVPLCVCVFRRMTRRRLAWNPRRRSSSSTWSARSGGRKWTTQNSPRRCARATTPLEDALARASAERVGNDGRLGGLTVPIRQRVAPSVARPRIAWGGVCRWRRGACSRLAHSPRRRGLPARPWRLVPLLTRLGVLSLFRRGSSWTATPSRASSASTSCRTRGLTCWSSSSSAPIASR